MRLTEAEFRAILARGFTSHIATSSKRPKFGNVKTRGFASKKEAGRYDALKLRLKAGDITKLECQPVFIYHTLTPDGEWVKVGKYTPDFGFIVARTGEQIYEDVKGGRATRTTAYFQRKRAVEAEYGIQIQEI